MMLVLGKMTYDMMKSDKLKEEAERKINRSFNNIIVAEGDRQAAAEKMNMAVEKLLNRKKGILNSSIIVFIELYEQIMIIERKTESTDIELVFFTPTVLSKLRTEISIAKLPTPSSDMTKNMIEGAVVGGLLFGGVGLLLGITGSIVDDSEKEVSLAKMQAKQARLIVAQAETMCLSYEVITERVKRLADLLAKLNCLLHKSLTYTKLIIKKNGNNVGLYTEDELKAIGTCCNLAKTVKIIIDTPIIDNFGNLTKESFAAIESGEKCISTVSHFISSL